MYWEHSLMPMDLSNTLQWCIRHSRLLVEDVFRALFVVNSVSLWTLENGIALSLKHQSRSIHALIIDPPHHLACHHHHHHHTHTHTHTHFSSHNVNGSGGFDGEGSSGSHRCPVLLTLHGTSISAADSADAYKVMLKGETEYTFG